jgi:hypothetical protein
VPNTEFEGGDDKHGYDINTAIAVHFLVKQAQSSHMAPAPVLHNYNFLSACAVYSFLAACYVVRFPC